MRVYPTAKFHSDLICKLKRRSQLDFFEEVARPNKMKNNNNNNNNKMSTE